MAFGGLHQPLPKPQPPSSGGNDDRLDLGTAHARLRGLDTAVTKDCAVRGHQYQATRQAFIRPLQLLTANMHRPRPLIVQQQGCLIHEVRSCSELDDSEVHQLDNAAFNALPLAHIRLLQNLSRGHYNVLFFWTLLPELATKGVDGGHRGVRRLRLTGRQAPVLLAMQRYILLVRRVISLGISLR